MKNQLFMAGLILMWFSVAQAQNCRGELVKKVLNSQYVSAGSIAVMQSHSCSSTACSILYKPKSGSFSNMTVLAFHDTQNGYQVFWAPVNNGLATGREEIAKNRVVYLSNANALNQGALTLNVSLETPRDGIFWPPHRVISSKKYNCLKN
jgi:hypothetical protein